MKNKILFTFNKYKGEGFFLIGNYFALFATMFNSALAAACIGPKELGILNSVLLFVPYSNFLGLGVINGLNRNLAFYEAQGEHKYVQKLIDASFTFSVFNAVVGFLLSILVAIILIPRGSNIFYILSFFLLALTLTLSPIALHYDTTYRSGQQFEKLGIILLKENFIYLLLSLLQIGFGFIGRIICNSARIIFRFLYRRKYNIYPINKYGEKKNIFSLMKVGFPMMISGYLWSVFIVTDQTIINKYLGTEKLGLYSLSVSLMSIITSIPLFLSNIFYPKASAIYGKAKSAEGLKSFYWKSLFVNIIVIIPLCTILYFLMDPMTKLLFPKYASGIEASKINLLTCMTFICFGPSSIIGVLKANGILILVYLVGIGALWIIVLLGNRNLTIELVSFYRFGINLILSIIILIYSYYLTTLKIFRK